MAHQFSLSKEITESACYQNSRQLMDILKSCELNWFSFVEVIKEKMKDYSKEAIDQLLIDFSGHLHLFNLEEREELIIEQSRQAFLLAQRLDNSDADDEAVVSEAEEMEVDWGNINDPLQKEAQSAIVQKVRNVRLSAKRKAAKKIAEERFLRRRRGKNVSKILKECPDIGQTIENYVRSAGAGADSRRRTVVLTLMVIVKYRRNQRSAELKNIWKWYTIESLGTVQLLNFVWLETSDGSHPYAIGVLQESHEEGHEKDSR